MALQDLKMTLFLVPTVPLLLVTIEVICVIVAKVQNAVKPPLLRLVLKNIQYGVLGLVLSLLATIAWMFWFEYTEGVSAGNAPLGWAIFYGPLSFGLGQFVALYRWWVNAY